MHKIELAVCDTNDEYRSRFVNYLVEHRTEEFVAASFSSCGIFCKILEEKVFDVVLLGFGFEEMQALVRERQIPLLILSEITSDFGERLHGNDEIDTKELSIFRYQPIEVLIHMIQVLAGGAERKVGEKRGFIGRMEVIGVCSPICHEMQMPFSVVLASVLAQHKKVLYVNLMEYSGFSELFGAAGDSDFGDVVLRIRNQRLCPENFSQSVYELSHFFYIPPFFSAGNLHELTAEDVRNFLEFLENGTEFEVIVIDVGIGFGECLQVLELCSSSYCLTKKGFFFDCQTKQFLDYANRKQANKILEHLHVLELPFSAKHLKAGSSILRQLLWSEFGDYVRNYLSGMGGCDEGF